MVDTKFTINTQDFDRIARVANRQIGRRMRGNFGDLRPFIKQSIGAEIGKNRNKFIPNSREAAELGVGEGGTIAVEKTETAWTALLPDSAEGVTTLRVRSAGGGNSELIGRVTVDIDVEAFIDAPRSIIDTESEEINEVGYPKGVIPWMHWFIFGASVRGYQFSNRSPIPRTSRTGGGIMVKGGLWDFRPRNRALIIQLFELLRKRINRDLKGEGAKRFQNLLRR